MNVNHAVRQDRKTLKSKGSEIVKPRRRPHASDKRQLTSLLDSGACPAGRGRQAYALYLAVSCVAPQRRETQSSDRCVAFFAPDDNPVIFTCLCAIGATGLCIPPIV